jgi:hypothetical protein
LLTRLAILLRQLEDPHLEARFLYLRASFFQWRRLTFFTFFTCLRQLLRQELEVQRLCLRFHFLSLMLMRTLHLFLRTTRLQWRILRAILRLRRRVHLQVDSLCLHLRTLRA